MGIQEGKSFWEKYLSPSAKKQNDKEEAVMWRYTGHLPVYVNIALSPFYTGYETVLISKDIWLGFPGFG